MAQTKLSTALPKTGRFEAPYLDFCLIEREKKLDYS